MIEVVLLTHLALAPVRHHVIELGFIYTGTCKVEDIGTRYSVIPDACNRTTGRREESGASDFPLEDISRLDDHLHMDGSARGEVSGRDFLVAVAYSDALGVAAPNRPEFVEEIEDFPRIIDKKSHYGYNVSR